MISRRLVRTLAQPPTYYTRRRRGLVTAVSTGPPVTVTALFADQTIVSPTFPGAPAYTGTPIGNLICDAAYAAAPPAVGDFIYALQSGPNWTVLGKTSP